MVNHIFLSFFVKIYRATVLYYLPPVDRLYELEDGFDVSEEVKERYKDVPYVQELKKQGKI